MFFLFKKKKKKKKMKTKYETRYSVDRYGANRGIKTWAMGISLAVLIAFNVSVTVKKVNNRTKRDNNKAKCGRKCKPKASRRRPYSYIGVGVRQSNVSKLFQRLIAQTNKYSQPPQQPTDIRTPGPVRNQSIHKPTNWMFYFQFVFSHSSLSIECCLHRV